MSAKSYYFVSLETFLFKLIENSCEMVTPSKFFKCNRIETIVAIYGYSF